MKRNIILSMIALFFSTSLVSAQTDEDRYARKMLLEEFTTENCGNCPAVASLVAQLLFKDEYKDNVITVTHHAGFGTDWLTTEADENLIWFYNSNSTYCPALMFDRYPNFYDDYSHNRTAVGFVSNLADIEKYTKRRLNKKSHVGLDITADYNGDRKVVVTVKGDRTKDFSNTPPRIFVYITEDRVPAQRQAGASKGYKHSHVLRAYNSIWGDELVWNGDNFEYECTIYIDKEWNQDEMQILAFVSAFDVEDATECVVENAREIPFTSATNGIEDASMEKKVVKTEYFTLDGVKTNEMNSGLYIEKKFFTDGTQESKKIVR